MATAYTASVGSRFNHGVPPGGNYLTDYGRPSHAQWPESSVRSRTRDVDEQNLASTALRGWRFPASRRFLWDRTPLGTGVTVCATDFLPEAELMNSAFMAASQFLTSGTNTKSGIRLSGKWTTCDDGKITLSLERLDQSLPQGDRGQGLEHTLISCMKQGGDASKAIGQLIRLLSDRFALTMDQCKETAKVSSLYPIRCVCEISSQSLLIEGKLLCPNGMLSMTPLYGKRVFDLPLAKSLQASMQETTLRPQTGFMTMDQSRALVPMLPEDAVTNGNPIVGLWASGVKSVVHPTVISGCYMLRSSTLLKDKAFDPDGAFLLLFYGLGATTCRLFECRIEGDGFSLYKFSTSSNLRPDPRGKAKVRLELDLKNALVEATNVEDPGMDTLAQPIGRKSPGPSIRGGSSPGVHSALSQSTGAAFESKIPVPPGHSHQQNHESRSNPWEEPSLLAQAKLDPALSQSRPPRPKIRPTLVLDGAPWISNAQSTSSNPSPARTGQNSYMDPSSLNYPWKNKDRSNVQASEQTVTPVWHSNVASNSPPVATGADMYSYPWKSKDRTNGQGGGQTASRDRAATQSWSSNAQQVHQRALSGVVGSSGGDVNHPVTAESPGSGKGVGGSQGRAGGFASQTLDGVGNSPHRMDRPALSQASATNMLPVMAPGRGVVDNVATARYWDRTNSTGSSIAVGNGTPRGTGTTLTPTTTPQAGTHMHVSHSSLRSNEAGRGGVTDGVTAPHPTFHESQTNATPPVDTPQPHRQAAPGMGPQQEAPRSVFTFMPNSGGSLASTARSGPARLGSTWTSGGIPTGDPSQNPLRAAVLAQQRQRNSTDGPPPSRFSEPPVRASFLRSLSQTAPAACRTSAQCMPPRPPMRPTTNWMNAVQKKVPPPSAAQPVTATNSAPPAARPAPTPQIQVEQKYAAVPPGWADLSNDPDVLKMEILQLREKVAVLEKEVQRQADALKSKACIVGATPTAPSVADSIQSPGVEEGNEGAAVNIDSISQSLLVREPEIQNQSSPQKAVELTSVAGCKTGGVDDKAACAVVDDKSKGAPKKKKKYNEVLINGERAIQVLNPDSSFLLSSYDGSSDKDSETSNSGDNIFGSGGYDDTKSETSSSSSATSVCTHDWDELATYELEAGSETDDERIYRKYGMECFDHYPPYWWLPQDLSFDSLVHMEKIGCITNSAKAWENQGKPLPKIEAAGGLTFEQAMKRRNKCRKKKHAFKKQHEEKYLKDLLGEEKIVTTLETKMMKITEGKKKKSDGTKSDSSEDEHKSEEKTKKKKMKRGSDDGRSLSSSSSSPSDLSEDERRLERRLRRKRKMKKKRAEERRLSKKKSEERKTSNKKKSSKRREELVHSSDVTFQECKASSSKSSSSEQKSRKSSGKSRSPN